MSNTLKLLSLVLVALGFAFLGCEDFGGKAPAGAQVDPPTDPFTATIWAGQTMPVGELNISFTNENLYFDFAIDTDNYPDWYFEDDIAIHIATCFDSIPQKGGKPEQSKFDYRYTVDHVQHFMAVIPWQTAWRTDPELYIAAHCVVDRYINGIEQEDNETGWAGDSDGGGKRWWKYFKIPTPKTLEMPSDSIQFKPISWIYQWDIPVEFWVLPLYEGGDMGDLDDEYYPGFCLQSGQAIYGKYWYPGWAYSCFDHNLPNCAKYVRFSMTELIPYDKIAWLINAYPPSEQEEDSTLVMDMEEVFWVYTGWWTPGMLSTERAKKLYADANLYGDGYYPYVAGGGAWMPIVLFTDCKVQLVFIQVDP